MATNIKASIPYDRRGVVYSNTGALGASLTTAVNTPLTNQQGLAARLRGKDIGHFFLKKDSGSSANFAAKIQDSDGPPVDNPHLAESSWVWRDVITFTALTTDAATSEYVEATVPLQRYVRAVFTRTGGTVTGLECGYKYRQCGPRFSGLVLPGATG